MMPDKPRIIAGADDALARALYDLPPRARSRARLAMARRDAAGLQHLMVNSPYPDDWQSWPAEGHILHGQPVLLDDSLERPEIRYQPYLGPPLPTIPPEPPTLRESARTAGRALVELGRAVRRARRRRTR